MAGISRRQLVKQGPESKVNYSELLVIPPYVFGMLSKHIERRIIAE